MRVLPRHLLRLLLALASASAACGDDLAAPPLPPVADPIPYVDPTIGSGGFGYAAGSAFPGAAAPNGLAKVGPDTAGPFGTIAFLHYAGYWAGDDTIQGFSHLHLHGTGLPDYGLLALMPTDGPIDAARTAPDGYQSSFARDSEQAAPGYYAVTLDRGGIRVEITASAHAAHHRIQYAPGVAGQLVIDLGKHLASGAVESAEIALYPDEQRMSGRLRSLGGMTDAFGGHDLFFDAVTRQPWTASLVWSDGGAPAPGTAAAGSGVGCGLSFAPSAAPVEVQVGLSLVSAEAARANREAEMPAWDFAAARAAVEGAWRALLSRVEIEGGSEAERRMFYSALYRAFLMPTAASDVDGGYRFGAGEPAVADGFRFMTDMSLWDTYRTLHPLYDLLAPEVARDAARSLVAMAGALGFFPRWPIATGESGVMLGASAEIVLADALVKGVDDFDAAGAYAVLRAAALDPEAPAAGRGGRGDIDEYLELGYVPASRGRSASTTVEYAWDDRALASLAAALGEQADADRLAARSLGWRQLHDPAVGFVRARGADGSFPPAGDFDPTEFSDDYAEANAWQTLFSAFHDPAGMIELVGGEQALVDRLEELFNQAESDLAARPQDDMIASSLPRPFYWHGNEPDLHAAYLFALAGRPDRTARWVDWIRGALYRDDPGGLAGNDDGGTLSAWYVWSALGLYPVAGTDRYVLGAPLFARARVRLPGGTLTIEAAEGERTGQVLLDGAPVDGATIGHGDLAGGRTLRFE